MPDALYLTIEEVIAIHADLMESMGALATPLLHPDKLDSALNRPRQLAYYEPGADFYAQAILLAVGISQAQAFQDGNKRVAFVATGTFLAMNGIRIDGDSVAFSCWLICAAGNISNDDLDVVAEHIGLDLAARFDSMTREAICQHFEDWLRRNASPQDPFELQAGGE